MNILDIFEEDGEIFHFFAYTVITTAHMIWAISTHQIASPSAMTALFGASFIELLILANLSDWSFIRLLTNKKEDHEC